MILVRFPIDTFGDVEDIHYKILWRDYRWSLINRKGSIISGPARIQKNKTKQYMFNLDKFIADSVTFRPVSMFAADIVVTRTPYHAEWYCRLD